MNKSISTGRKEAIKFDNRSKGQKKGWLKRKVREAKEKATILKASKDHAEPTSVPVEDKTPKSSRVKVPSETMERVTAHADFLLDSYNITLSVTNFITNAIREKLERIEKKQVRKG